MDWKSLLADVRAHLPASPAGRGVQRGSLRWLEAEMARLGGNPATVRNIVYRDVGTQADKEVLGRILAALAQEAGRSLDLPARVTPLALPPELELLGRSKKLVYKQFLGAVRAGRAPRLVVYGRGGSGKTVLLSNLAQALEAEGLGPVRRLNLSGDAFRLSPPARPPGRDYASLAAAQWEWLGGMLSLPHFRAGETKNPVPVLLRVTADLNFGGQPPRLPDGSAGNPAACPACAGGAGGQGGLAPARAPADRIAPTHTQRGPQLPDSEPGGDPAGRR